MKKRRFIIFIFLMLTLVALPLGTDPAHAGPANGSSNAMSPANTSLSYTLKGGTLNMRERPQRMPTAADRAAIVHQSEQKALLPRVAAPAPGGTPDYFATPNWANSPPLRKFVDNLPGLGSASASNLGQYIP